MAVPTVLLLLPQFVGVLQQAEIIVGHAFVTHEGKKRGLIDALVQHTRHLNDFPIQWVLIVLAAIGGAILVVQEGLVAARRVAGAGRCASCTRRLRSAARSARSPASISDLFYSDPRRLSAVVTMLLTTAAGIALFTLVSVAVRGIRRLAGDRARPALWYGATAAVLVAVSVITAYHYFPRHRSCSARSTTR